MKPGVLYDRRLSNLSSPPIGGGQGVLVCRGRLAVFWGFYGSFPVEDRQKTARKLRENCQRGVGRIEAAYGWMLYISHHASSLPCWFPEIWMLIKGLSMKGSQPSVPEGKVVTKILVHFTVVKIVMGRWSKMSPSLSPPDFLRKKFKAQMSHDVH